MPRTIVGSDMRATPPARRMSAGTRSRAMTAAAPDASATFACSGVTFRGRLWGAVGACGGGGAAVSGHRTAAAVWGLSAGPSGKLERTARHGSASTPTLWVHRGSTPNPLDDVVRQPDGLPVTTVA